MDEDVKKYPELPSEEGLNYNLENSDGMNVEGEELDLGQGLEDEEIDNYDNNEDVNNPENLGLESWSENELEI